MCLANEKDMRRLAERLRAAGLKATSPRVLALALAPGILRRQGFLTAKALSDSTRGSAHGVDTFSRVLVDLVSHGVLPAEAIMVPEDRRKPLPSPRL